MNVESRFRKLTMTTIAVCSLFLAAQVSAADSIKGQVLGGVAPIAKSTVTLRAQRCHPLPGGERRST